MSTGQTPPPGWYPSERPGVSRYWDGARWTEHYHPSAPASGAPRAQSQDGTASYGTAPYGTAPYAAQPGAGYGHLAQPPRKGLGAGAWVAIIAGAVLVLAGGGIGIAAVSGAFTAPAAEQSANEDVVGAGPADDALEDASPEPTEEATDAPGSAQEQCETGEARNELLTSLTLAVTTSAFTEHPMDVSFSLDYVGGVCAVTLTAMPATAAEFNGNDMLGLLTLVISHAEQIPDYVTHVQMYGAEGTTGDRFSLADSFAELGGDPAGITADSGIAWPLDTLV